MCDTSLGFGQSLMLVGPGSVLVVLVVFDETTMWALCRARSSAGARGSMVAVVDLVGFVALLERAADTEADRCQGAAVAASRYAGLSCALIALAMQ
jgi:hypothetical protein